MSIKIQYNLNSNPKDYIATVPLETGRDYQLLLQAHVTSKHAWLYNAEMPELKVKIVADGLIETFTYNKRDAIMELLNNPDSVFSKIPDFPLDISDELRESIYGE